MSRMMEEYLQRQLRSAEQNLTDDKVRSLRQARIKALDSHRKPWVNKLRNFMWPATSMASACALVFVLIINLDTGTLTDNHSLVSDQQLEEQLEILEDLEFYHWLAEDEQRLRG